MQFVKVKDEDRPGDVAINLDLARQAHFGVTQNRNSRPSAT